MGLRLKAAARFLNLPSSYSAATLLAIKDANTGCISKLWSSNTSNETLTPENKSLVVHFFICLAKYSLIPGSMSLDMLCRPCSIATLDVTALPAKKSRTTDPSNDRLLINRSIIAKGFCVG
jgi:hypothetical protein